MPRVVYLDTGPLGLVSNPRPGKDRESSRVQDWMKRACERRIRIIVPAIADYELRRELIRSGSLASVARLDLIESGRHPDFPGVRYLPLTDAALKRATSLWAEARNKGVGTAANEALDGDVIIAAQILEDAGLTSRFTVATSNVGDIARYVGFRRTRHWVDIIP